MRYRQVAIGGTFDFLHQGHKALIDKAFEIGEKVFIGVVGDNLKLPPSFCIAELRRASKTQSSRLRSALQNYGGQAKLKAQKERIKHLEEYLKAKGFLPRATIGILNDIGGPTLTEPDFEANVVSEQTIKGAKEINRIRKNKGFKPLEMVMIPMEKDENGEIISSTRIRNGEINRQGFIYKNLFLKDITISPKFRNQLKKPQGKIVEELGVRSQELGENKKIIIVGDWTLKRFVKNKLSFDLAIIDNLCRRQPVDYFSDDWLKKRVIDRVKNPAGTISKDLVKAILKGIKKNKKESLIIVDGEEDLGAVPAILLSPLNSLIFYGQPEMGVVMIEVNEEIKEKLRKLLL